MRILVVFIPINIPVESRECEIDGRTGPESYMAR